MTPASATLVKRILVAAAFLVFASAINFGVAAYAARNQQRPDRYAHIDRVTYANRVNLPESWGKPSDISSLSSPLTSMQYASDWSGIGEFCCVMTWQFGFPLRSLRRLDGVLVGDSCGTGKTPDDRQREDKTRQSMTAATDRRLHIIWPNSLVNIAAYASSIAMACVPFVVVRRMRRRPGMCQRCGYDVLELPVCAECGMARGPDMKEPNQ